MGAGAGDDGPPASSNNMDLLMSGGSSSTVGAIDNCGTPLDNTAGTGDTDMSVPFSYFLNLDTEAAEEFEAHALAPQPQVQEDKVVMRERGLERLKVPTVPAAVAVEFDARITLQPLVQEGNVVTRKRGAKRKKLVPGVEPVAAGSKRQRTRSGPKDTTGAEDHDEQVLEEVAGNGGNAPRWPWTKEHDRSWWNKVSSSLLSAPQEFKRLFHMSPSTFEMVCQELGTAVAKNDTALRQAIPVCKRVAVCIWRLATGESLHEVAKLFGIGISTCQKIVIEVCAAIKALLMPKFLLWPNSAPAATAIAAEFEAAHRIPNIIGAIYNTHISIISPKSDAPGAYYNPRHTRRQKKPSYSITVQVVVDAVGSFTDICVGHPGSMFDKQVLLRSSLGVERGEAGLLQAERKWLVGGASYPVEDWMLAPYIDENLTVVQKMFNAKVAGVRKVAMDAAMRFKARWSLLRMRNEINMEDFPITLSACCVLHNICERRGDMLDLELAFDLVDDEMLAERPVHSEAASLLRDNIANVFFLHGDVGDVMPYISS